MVFDVVNVGDKFRDMTRKIVLTVTELTPKGFAYQCDPYHILPARMGPSEVRSGELFYRDHPTVNWDRFYMRVNNYEQGNRKNWPGQSETWVQKA